MSTRAKPRHHPRSLLLGYHRSAIEAFVSWLMPTSSPISVSRKDCGQERIVFAVDATKDPAKRSFDWALQNELIQRGDHVTLLGILHRIDNPMGYKSQANVSSFVGTNKKALEAEIKKKMDLFEQKYQPLSKFLDEMGVHFDITITAGIPLKLVLVREALKIKATYLILEWNLRKHVEYYKARLQCPVVYPPGTDAELVQDLCLSCLSYLGWPTPMKKKPTHFAALSSPDSPATSVTDSIPLSHRSHFPAKTCNTGDCPIEEMEISVPIHKRICSVDPNNRPGDSFLDWSS